MKDRTRATLRVRYAGIAAALLTACTTGPVAQDGARSDGDRPVSPPPTAIAEGHPCPAEGAGIGCRSETRGDLDGEPGAETFAVYADLDERGFPQVWSWSVTDTAGATVSTGRLRAPSSVSYPVVLGSADADARPGEEIFIKLVIHLYHAGATRDVGIFRFDDGDLTRVRDEDGAFLFAVGGVSTFGQGAECRDVDLDGEPEFVRLRVDYVGARVQRARQTVYEWVDGHLAEKSIRRYRFSKTSRSDPLLIRHYGFACFELDPPFPY